MQLKGSQGENATEVILKKYKMHKYSFSCSVNIYTKTFHLAFNLSFSRFSCVFYLFTNAEHTKVAQYCIWNICHLFNSSLLEMWLLQTVWYKMTDSRSYFCDFETVIFDKHYQKLSEKQLRAFFLVFFQIQFLSTGLLKCLLSGPPLIVNQCCQLLALIRSLCSSV